MSHSVMEKYSNNNVDKASDSTPRPPAKKRKFSIPFRSPLVQCSSSGSSCSCENSCTSTPGLPHQKSLAMDSKSSTCEQHIKPTCSLSTNLPAKQTSTPVSRRVALGGRGKGLTKKFQSPILLNKNHCESTPNKIELQEAREELRRLKLVEYHKKHNDLNTLNSLTSKWSEAGHKAVHELRELIHQDPKPEVGELLNLLGIPVDHIKCDCDNEND